MTLEWSCLSSQQHPLYTMDIMEGRLHFLSPFSSITRVFDRRVLKCNSKDGCLEFCNNITVIGSYAILVDFPDLIREYLERCAGAAL